jgi:hypothetical protein
MTTIHARYLKLEVTCDESADTIVIDAMEFFRNGQDYLLDANAYTVPFSGGTAAAEPVALLGSVIPPFTHIALESTFQA